MALMLAMGLAVFAALMPVPSQAAVTSEEAARMVAEQFSVKVLRVRAAVLDSTPVWLITVMNAGGNNNDAFQVNTLAVDQDSGELIPSFRHGASGYDLPGVHDRSTRIERRPESSRSGAWR
ncbi:MAG TPA: hypothetical protein VGA60_03070 [Kiloniellales bacterium]